MAPPLLALLILAVLHNHGHGSQNTDVDCVMNTRKVLTCRWDHPHPPAINYTFYYREGRRRCAVCPQYLVLNATNVGCRLSIAEPYEEFQVELNSSAAPLVYRNFRKLQDYVRMDRPHKLRIEVTPSLELMVRWEQSYGDIPPHCVIYRVRHRATPSDIWTEKDASVAMSALSSFDVCHNYTFQVKSKVANTCANALMWSEWSEGATWARNATACEDLPARKQSPVILQVGITVGLAVLFVAIVLAVIGQERIWVILVPQIPNPGKKFEELINGCSAQDWVGVSKETMEKMKLNYTETLCAVTEDPECAAVTSHDA